MIKMARSFAALSAVALSMAVVAPSYATPVNETTFSGTVDFEQSMRITCNISGKIKYVGGNAVLYDIVFSPGNILCGTVVKPNGKEWVIPGGAAHGSNNININFVGASTVLGGYCEDTVSATIVDNGADHKITITNQTVAGTPSNCKIHNANILTS